MKIPLLLLTLFLYSLQDASDQEVYIHRLTQSTSSFQIWTAPPSYRPYLDHEVPEYSEDAIKVYCAKHEFESFVVIVSPSSEQTVHVELSGPIFENVNIKVELFHVQSVLIQDRYKDDGMGCDEYPCWVPDILFPIEEGEDVNLPANQNTAINVRLYVGEDVVGKKDYSGIVKIGGIEIPVNLHVFNFALSKKLHIKGQLNFNFDTFFHYYGLGYNMKTSTEEGKLWWDLFDSIHKDLIEHRMVPKSGLWPYKLRSKSSNFNCTTNELQRDFSLRDYRDTDGVSVAEKLLNIGYNDATYSSHRLFDVACHASVTSSVDLPDKICGVELDRDSDFFTLDETTEYNKLFFKYLSDVQNILVEDGWLDEYQDYDIYYYLWDEPEPEQHTTLAWWAEQVKKAAPLLRTSVTDPPSPTIYDVKEYPEGKIHIWVPDLKMLSWENVMNYSFARQHYCDEDVWVYFLDYDTPPFLNPISIDHTALDGKILGFFYWKYRLTGVLYYAWNLWERYNPYEPPSNEGDRNGGFALYYPPDRDREVIDPFTHPYFNKIIPSIRLETFRDGIEDYEYLYYLNDGYPEAGEQGTKADRLAHKIVKEISRYERNDEYVYNLRRLIGLYNGKEISEIPFIEPPKFEHSRCDMETDKSTWNYYINFQNPEDEPLDDPLIVDGITWEKIGWDEQFEIPPEHSRLPKDAPKGYGWIPAKSYDDFSAAFYMTRGSGKNVLENSVMYENNGWPKDFYYVLPKACYDVTVGICIPGRTSGNNSIYVQGKPLFKNMPCETEETKENTINVCVYDYLMNMRVGDPSKFVSISYMKIEYTNDLPEDEEPYPPVQFEKPEDEGCYLYHRTKRPTNKEIENQQKAISVIVTLIVLVISFFVIVLIVLAVLLFALKRGTKNVTS